MVKCPVGTAEQINSNLAYLKCLNARTETTCETEDGDKPASDDLAYPEDDDYLSTAELDVILADKRNPPSTEDEITYLFVNHFLEILLKCWNGTPCLKPKVTRQPEAPESEHGEASEESEEKNINSTEEYLNDLYKTKSQKLLQDKQDKASMEETLSAICRERCESRKSTMSEPDMNEDEELSWKAMVPDEDVYMSFQNGAWYSGRVSRRLMDGDGTFFWEDGASFQGEFVSGTATGFGRLEFTNLSVYEGGVYKGFRHGEGLQCMYDSPVMYSGEWWLGKKNGHGIIFYSNPIHGLNFYNGSWVNGVQEGFGCRQYQSGSKYIGNWKNGKRHGTGIMFWCNNDKRNGVGVLEPSNGSIIETIWVDNEKNGPGAVVCPNGIVVMSNRKLFNNDKPALLNETEENLVGKLFRSHGFQASRKKSVKKETAKMPEQSQLLAYMSSMEKAKAISIPIHTPVHSLDLSCHARRLRQQKNEAIQRQKEQANVLGLNNTPRMESFAEKKALNDMEMNQSEEVFSAEEKLLRYCIMVNLTRLKACYEEWSTIACKTKPPFDCILIRLFFWELLTVSGVPMRNFSLIDIDNLLASEASFLIDSPHDPFEKIQLWQFIHFLIAISYQMYGRYIYAENISPAYNDAEDFLQQFYRRNEKAVLSSAFSYFLQNHIFSDRRLGNNPINNWDLLPMGAMYLAYKNLGEPHSAKEFLVDVFRKKEEQKSRSSVFLEVADLKQMGKNVIPITNEVSYLTSEEPFNTPEVPPVWNDGNETASNEEKFCFTNLGAKDIVNCLIQACPNIMEDDLIVDIEYQLTFLEYYKAIIACAAVSQRKKTLKQIQSEIMSNYKRELEEYDRQMKEYDKHKESLMSLSKKVSQMKKPKK